MNDDRVDQLLDRLRTQGHPIAPDLRSFVRAEIHRRRELQAARGGFSSWLAWLSFLSQPRMAAAGACLALAIGVFAGSITLPAAARGTDIRMARVSLHLDVFDASWTTITAAAAPMARR